MLNEHGLKPNIMIDCSHANSQKQYARQTLVMNDIADQIVNGNQSIKALMIESNLHAGNQSLTENINALHYGVSITDPCIDWETTERSLHSLRNKLPHILQGRKYENLVKA